MPGSGEDDGYAENSMYKMRGTKERTTPSGQTAMCNEVPAAKHKGSIIACLPGIRQCVARAQRSSVRRANSVAGDFARHQDCSESSTKRAKFETGGSCDRMRTVRPGTFGRGLTDDEQRATRVRMTKVRTSVGDLFHTATVEEVPKTFADTMKLNAMRESVLQDARRLSPISAVMHASKLRISIVPRLFSYQIVWVVLVVYVACATFARSGLADGGNVFGDMEEQIGAFDGASVLVTFMVVFYLGYCYSRHFEQYAALRDAMSTVIDIMLNARICLKAEDTRRAYCYLNLMHATAYVGMTVRARPDAASGHVGSGACG